MDDYKAIQNYKKVFNEKIHLLVKACNEISDSNHYECVSHSQLNDTQSYDNESILSSTSSVAILHQLLAPILAKLSAVEESVKEFQNQRKKRNDLFDNYVTNTNRKLANTDRQLEAINARLDKNESFSIYHEECNKDYGENDEEMNGLITIENIELEASIDRVRDCLKENNVKVEDIDEYDFYLEDNKLQNHRSIIEQCDLVENAKHLTKLINIQLVFNTELRRVNLLDILKPMDNPDKCVGTDE